MRNEPNLRINGFRSENHPLGMTPSGMNWGYFEIKRNGELLRVISSGTPDEEFEWEHVSISLAHRCPTWNEMYYVKNLFWREDETVIQFHPKKSKYINEFPYVLHLWKKIGEDHELPPDICV